MSRAIWLRDEADGRFLAKLVLLVIALFGWAVLFQELGMVLPLPSGAFPSDVSAVMGGVGAFSLAVMLDNPLDLARGKARGLSVLRPAISPALAVLVSPLCGLFPPATAFLCRAACPEPFYYLRPVTADGEGEGASARGSSVRLRVMAVLSCVLMGATALAMLAGGLDLLREQGVEDFAALLLIVPAACIAGMVALVRGRTHAPGCAQRIAFLMYHGFELLFWTSFWLAVAGWCLAAGR